ncbi:class I SAM-dependent methyltransferase [Patescibacteria group bacterium]|nr:class I SAM-dependent methyltransferase [Patescibacteria group bacterium]
MEGFLNPQEVLNQLKLEGDMIAADFGSGSGGWAIPLAKRLKFGRVYAIDILEEPLSALKSKTEIEKVYNIETVRSNVEQKQGSKLADSFCHLVLMTNLLFEAKDKKTIMNEAKRVLRKKGKILVVDWLPETPLGPKERRVSADEVKKIAQNLELKLEKEFKAGVYHYGLVFSKP